MQEKKKLYKSFTDVMFLSHKVSHFSMSFLASQDAVITFIQKMLHRNHSDIKCSFTAKFDVSENVNYDKPAASWLPYKHTGWPLSRRYGHDRFLKTQHVCYRKYQDNTDMTKTAGT